MQTPDNWMKLLPMPVTDALNSERWRLLEPLSVAYVSDFHKVQFHLWMFISRAPVNATEYLFVAWGSGVGHSSVVLALGANDLEKSLSLVGSELKAQMQLPPGGHFVQEERQRYPWIRFVTEVLTTTSVQEPSYNAQGREPPTRTVETMLETVTLFGKTFDQTTARAVATLSNPTASTDDLKNVIACCLSIGKACREREMEAVFWSVYLWNEAIHGAEIFIDTNVPSLYIPDGSQFWYFEHPLPADLDPKDPRYAWWTPAWQLSGMALLPIRRDGKEMCLSVCILEKARTDRDSVDDVLPRVLLRSIGIAGDPCLPGYALCMAGQEFMQEVIPRTPYQYSRQVQRAAERRGEKLHPCSIMEVRRVESVAEQKEDGEGQKSGSRNYHYSFFQRRHRRRLKEPRKSDGVQVIRVAAGQKFKHLPLLPEAQQKVTRVSR